MQIFGDALTHRCLGLCAVLALQLTTSRPAFGEGASAEPDAAVSAAPSLALEVKLPVYKQTALNNDAPVQDALPDQNGMVWMLTRSMLWRWDVAARSLNRLDLANSRAPTDQSPFRHLGTDGLSLFAATDLSMYQIQWRDGRIYRYAQAAGDAESPAFGFSGQGDQFWMLGARALMRFDRYGRSLTPKFKVPFLAKSDLPAFDPDGRRLWFARGASIYVVDFNQPKAPPREIFKAGHRVAGLSWKGSVLVAHTGSTVLRLTPDGRQLGSIPVEGRRQLLTMDLTGGAHAYLFSDRLLEVYDTDSKRLLRYFLPVEQLPADARIRYQRGMVVVLMGGAARAFTLSGDR